MSNENLSTLPRKIEVGDVIPVTIEVNAKVIERTSGIITLEIIPNTIPQHVLRNHRSLWNKSPRK